MCKCLSLVGGSLSLVTFGLPTASRLCGTDVPWVLTGYPPACSHIQGDVTAERQPFVVGVSLEVAWSWTWSSW